MASRNDSAPLPIPERDVQGVTASQLSIIYQQAIEYAVLLTAEYNQSIA